VIKLLITWERGPAAGRSTEVLEIGDEVEVLAEGKEFGKGIDVTIPRVEDQAPGGVVMVIVAVHVCKHSEITRG
jgi:hypothetical protein